MMEIKICPNCNSAISQKASHCPKCGVDFSEPVEDYSVFDEYSETAEDYSVPDEYSEPLEENSVPDEYSEPVEDYSVPDEYSEPLEENSVPDECSEPLENGSVSDEYSENNMNDNGTDVNRNQDAMIQCRQCGEYYKSEYQYCPHCGNPSGESHRYETGSDGVRTHNANVYNDHISKKDRLGRFGKAEVIEFVHNNSRIVISAALIVLVVITITGLFIHMGSQKKYEKNLQLVTAKMFSGARKAESAGGLIHDVWYNTIFEEDDVETDPYTKSHGSHFNSDFNTSLAKLYADSSFSSDIEYIENNQDSVEEIMKKLKNPSDQYQDEYDACFNLYEAYVEFTDLVTDPSGTLTTYTSNFNDADSEFVKKYKKMKIILE